MKQINSFYSRGLRWGVAALMLVTSVAANAYDFILGGLYYDIISSSNLTCGVTHFSYDSSENSAAYRGTITIPSTVTYWGTTYKVTVITYAAFRGCTSLTKVTIGSNVTSINQSAFSGCTGLKEVAGGENITSIGSSAFYGCSSLTEFTIPSGVRSISPGTLANCSSLTEVTIHENVTSIGSQAFWGCTGLTKFEVEEGNKNYCAKDGVLFTKDMKELVQFPAGSSMTSYTIPESVTTIDDYAFAKCSNLKEITIPSSVKTIGDYAFQDCAGLTQATIGNGVTTIGDYAFNGCEGLTQVNFNATACTTAGSSQGPAFSGCTANIIFGDNVTIIPSYLFYENSMLTEFTFPNSVTTIGDYVFYKCSNLAEVNIPNSVQKMGDYVFYQCSGLTKVTIGNGLTSIGSYAFYNCTKLKTLTIEDGEETLSMPTSSSYTPFTGCPLEILYLGRNVSYNSTYSPFRDNETLSSLTIGEKVTDIPFYLFYNCSGIDDELLIPNSVTSIGDYAFYDCNGLTTVGIGNGVTSIGDSAFYNCRTMKELTIGSRVVTIGNSAFDSCRRLESLTSLNTTPPTCSASGNGVFYNVPVKTCTLYVTEGSLDAYASAYAWEDFLTIIDNQVDAIEDIMTNGSAEAVGYYTLDGKQVPSLQRGINIVRYSDGTSKKVLAK